MITEMSTTVPAWQKIKDEIKRLGLKQDFVRQQLRNPPSQSHFSNMLNGIKNIPDDIHDQIWAFLYKYK